MALPKATVQLQPPTQPFGSSPPPQQMGTMVSTADDEDENGNEGIINILSIVGFVAALVVLAFQLMTANVWISAEDNARVGEWSQLME